MHNIIGTTDSLYGFGNNNYGQIDHNTNGCIYSPQRLAENNSITQIACGWNHSMILDSDKNVIIFGQLNQLGTSSYSKISITGYDVAKIACGGYFSLILEKNGNLYGFGSNSCGQLGLGHNDYQDNVHYITSNVKDVVCGGCHTIILKHDNNLFVCGSNSYGQLGLGHFENQYTPQLLMTDSDSNSNSDITQIACGSYHSIILKKNGDVLTFGYNRYGQLGFDHKINTTIPTLLMCDLQIRQIGAGSSFTIVLKKNGELLFFGKNFDDIYDAGSASNQGKIIMIDPTITNIACMETHMLILKKNRDLYVCGSNGVGQLGMGHNVDWSGYNCFISYNKPQFLMSDIILIPNTRMPKEWKYTRHHFFCAKFQRRIQTFLTILQIKKAQSIIRHIPKFIRFEIIKYCV